MRVGLGQIDIAWENKGANLLKCEDFLKRAKDNSIELLVFPEMTLTGFSMNIENIAEGPPKQSPSVKWFSEKAIEYNINIAFGYTEKCGEKGLNNLVIISNKGEVLSKYSKLHPFSYGEESNYYIAGDSFTLTKLKDFVVGSTICYDLRFPELYQVLSKKAELILVIANWPEKRNNAWITQLKSRAMENQCYIVGVNKVGFFGSNYYSGDSMIISPLGEVLKSLSHSEDLVYEDINIEEVTTLRENFALKKDRRNNLYIKGLTSDIAIMNEGEVSHDIS